MTVSGRPPSLPIFGHMYWTRTGNLDHVLIEELPSDDGQLMAGFSVRMGSNDFPFSQSGILNLFSELLFDGLGESVNYEGHIGHVISRYYVRGDRDDVETALKTMFERIVSPPVDRLEYAKKKTQLRFERWQPSIGAQIASKRFGFAGPGIQSVFPYPIETIDGVDVGQIANHFINSSNVVVFSSGEFSSNFELNLHEGQKREAPTTQHLIQAPVVIPTLDERGLCFDLMVGTDAASRIGYGLVYRSLHNRICEMELLSPELSVFDHRSGPNETQRTIATWCDPANHKRIQTAIVESFDDLISGDGPLDFNEITELFVERECQDAWGHFDDYLNVGNLPQTLEASDITYDKVQSAIAEIWKTRILVENKIEEIDFDHWGSMLRPPSDEQIKGSKYRILHPRSKDERSVAFTISESAVTMKTRLSSTTTNMSDCLMVVRDGNVYNFFDRRGYVTTIEGERFSPRFGKNTLIDKLKALKPIGPIVTESETEPQKTSPNYGNKNRLQVYLLAGTPVLIVTAVFSLLRGLGL